MVLSQDLESEPALIINWIKLCKGRSSAGSMCDPYRHQGWGRPPLGLAEAVGKDKEQKDQDGEESCDVMAICSNLGQGG